MRTVHLLTIQPEAGAAATNLAMAGIAAILKSRGVTWWITPPAPGTQGLHMMARIPEDMPEVSLQELLAAYTPPVIDRPAEVTPW